MAASLSGVFNVQELLDSGAPMAGGRLYTYATGTTTHKTAYTNKAGTTPHTYTSDGAGGQYIALNSRGEIPGNMYFAAGAYDVVLKTPAGATVWTRRADQAADPDDYSSGDSGKGAALVAANPDDTTAPEGSLGAYLHVRRERFNVMDAIPLAERAAISARVSGYDTLPHFMEALDYFGTTSSAARGVIEVPQGIFKVSGKIPLRFETSLRGLAGRASTIQATGDFPVVGWEPLSPSFSRQVAITDLWLIGNGSGSGGTNSCAIDIDHPYGIDDLELKRLYITGHSTYGIRTNQPGGTSVNCQQFASWENINISDCANGMKLGFGFTGESVFSNIAIVGMTGKCVEFVTNSVPVGPQGLNFNGLWLGQSGQGIVFNGGTAGQIIFNGLHVENMTTNCIEFNSAATAQVTLNNPWLVRAPSLIKCNAGGVVDIVSGTWEVINAAHKYIEVTASSSFLIKLSGNHRRITSGTGVAPTDDITAPDINVVYGTMLRKSTTAATIVPRREAGLTWQGRGIMSETATVAPNNLSGGTAIANGATSTAVTFSRNETDTGFRVQAVVSNGTASGSTWTPSISIGSKATTGFTAYFSSAAPAGGWTLEWVLTR